jgi:hypothetical protein
LPIPGFYQVKVITTMDMDKNNVSNDKLFAHDGRQRYQIAVAHLPPHGVASRTNLNLLASLKRLDRVFRPAHLCAPFTL